MLNLVSSLTFSGLAVVPFHVVRYGLDSFSLCWFQASAPCPTFSKFSSDSSSLTLRSDTASLKTETLTGLTVDKQSASENCPSDLVASTAFIDRNAPRYSLGT